MYLQFNNTKGQQRKKINKFGLNFEVIKFVCAYSNGGLGGSRRIHFFVFLSHQRGNRTRKKKYFFFFSLSTFPHPAHAGSREPGGSTSDSPERRAQECLFCIRTNRRGMQHLHNCPSPRRRFLEGYLSLQLFSNVIAYMRREIYIYVYL